MVGTGPQQAMVAHVPESFDFVFHPRVPEISLELTNVCNLKCPYCANPALTRSQGGIGWELFEKIVDECSREGYDLAWLHGVGEPLLLDRLEEAVALIKRKHAGRGSFGTNGTLLNADRIRKLLDAGLESLYVSIDSLDPAIYKATRGGKLEKVIENVRTLIAMAPPSFSITIALMNHRDQTIGDRERARFRELFGDHRNVLCNTIDNALMPSAPEDYRASTEKQHSCVIPSRALFVDKDGIVALCCSDQDSLHPLGDLKRQSIKEVWFSQANQVKFRNIALGVHECPDLCTKNCVLKEPRRGSALVASAGFSLPLAEVRTLLQRALDDGNVVAAQDLLQALSVRDPYDRSVVQMMHSLATLQQPDSSLVA
jgi:MoaA/NifB/PqqE/SkfB family radical SAM enzyme